MIFHPEVCQWSSAGKTTIQTVQVITRAQLVLRQSSRWWQSKVNNIVICNTIIQCNKCNSQEASTWLPLSRQKTLRLFPDFSIRNCRKLMEWNKCNLLIYNLLVTKFWSHLSNWLKSTQKTEHQICNKSSAVAEMGDRGHNRHGPKKGGAAMSLSWKLGPRVIQCGEDCKCLIVLVYFACCFCYINTMLLSIHHYC